MTKLLFITWDSDQTNYLETLFFPILEAIQNNKDYECHVMQFSWAGGVEVKRLQTLADTLGLVYKHYPINRKPLLFLGVMLAVFRGVFYIKNHVQEHNIQVVMPRSTMPAMMVNRLQDWLSRNSIKLVFDADGLPLEERLDFTDLEQNSIRYKWLKGEEVKILKRADSILTRSDKSIKIHLKKIGEEHLEKFHKVSNGRSAKTFFPSSLNRVKFRQQFGLSAEDKLFVYSGSLGTQYCLQEMMDIFTAFLSKEPKSRFLILTMNNGFLKDRIPKDLKTKIFSIQGDFDLIPDYLSAADVAFSLRKPAPSLAGLAPIKLGEYIIMGLPVILSTKIGDSEALLKNKPFCFLYQHDNPDRISEVIDWIKSMDTIDRNEIREFGIKNFSLEKSIQEYSLALSNLE